MTWPWKKAAAEIRLLIQRVLGDPGHLSNEQAAALVREVLARSRPGKVRHLVQLHLSRQCNSPTLAQKAARQMLNEIGVRVNRTHCSTRFSWADSAYRQRQPANDSDRRRQSFIISRCFRVGLIERRKSHIGFCRHGGNHCLLGLFRHVSHKNKCAGKFKSLWLESPPHLVWAVVTPIFPGHARGRI